MEESLIDVIDRLDEVDDSDRFVPPCIFAEGGPDAVPTARAMVCPADEEGSFLCPRDPALSYILTVRQAKRAIEVWSKWRGRKAARDDKVAAVMYYSHNDAWLPLE